MISLECSFSKLAEMYIASCERLGIIDQGRTEEEAIHNLQISLTLFLKEFDRQEVLERLLKELGINFTQISADHPLPEVMDEPQVLAEVGVLVPHSAAWSRRDTNWKTFVPAYMWAPTRQGLGTV